MEPLLPDSQMLRDEMADRQLVRRGIADPLVLAAMRAVPRELFVSHASARYAYEDRALPIEAGQTISQPYVVALTIEAAGLSSASRVLEIGTGSGYAAAVLSRVARKVFTVEYHRDLAETAAARLSRLGCDNVEVRSGDGNAGWPDAAPFDAIVAAACAAKVPKAWKEQLKPGGRIVAPVGRLRQRLVRLTRNDGGGFEKDFLADVRFVPLLGG